MGFKNIQSSQWFRSYTQKLIAIAFTLAIIFSFFPILIGYFVPQIASVYLYSAYIVVFLTIFGICLILFQFHNPIARRLAYIISITSLLGALAHYWILITNLFLGIPLTYPNPTAYIAAAANLVMLVGFALVSIEQRRRSWRQIGGFVLITGLFAVCILSTYLMNLTFHPPIIPAIGTGLRILIGFLTAIFAWIFYFNQDPPPEVIGRNSRLLLVLASLVLILGYTAFAFQYAMEWNTLSVFYYAGSISDAITLFAIFIFLIAVLVTFTETLENMASSRPLSISYEVLNRVVLITSLIVVLTISGAIAITLIGRVLLVYLSPIDATIALQTIGTGLLIGLGIIIIIVAGAGYYLSRWLYQPLAYLEAETAAVTEPGIISYSEPQGLVLTELQGVSDSFAKIIDELSRVRAELRRFTITESRLRTPSTSQLAKLDYYLAIINNSVTNRIQTIMSLSEASRDLSDPKERDHIWDMIQTEITEIHYLLKSVQLLRLIDTQALPEFHRIDLTPLLTELITKLQEVLPKTTRQIAISLPSEKVNVLANEYVSHIFQPLIRLVLERDVGGPAIIEVTFTQVKESGIDYWQIDITHPKWVLPDIEKVLLFRSDPEQPQKANPNLLLVPNLVEYFRGKFRVKNIVIDDPQYGTVIQVLLPRANRRRGKPSPNDEAEEED
ncbi:MAG: hypothetical protein ACFFBR_04445 [Promethearchaeota archaeon]